jgi:hypothetical protein
MRGSSIDVQHVIERVRASRAGQKLTDPKRPQFSAADVAYAVDVNRFAFAMMVTREDDHHVMRPVWPR